MTKKRRRPIHLHVMVSEEEQALIRERMAEAGIRNMGAYMRKMALNGYVLHVDLSPVQEPVSYTHLDVYKRQKQSHQLAQESFVRRRQVLRRFSVQEPFVVLVCSGRLTGCLLYTSRCV